jgi:hypothetical protein
LIDVDDTLSIVYICIQTSIISTDATFFLSFLSFVFLSFFFRSFFLHFFCFIILIVHNEMTKKGMQVMNNTDTLYVYLFTLLLHPHTHCGVVKPVLFSHL